MRLFISYAHVDKAIVKDWVVNKLVTGGHDVWFDDRLVAGQDWKQQLSDEIERSDALVYCMTPESVASDWCQWELARAVDLGKPVITVLMQARTQLPDQLKKLQYVDFSDGPTGDAVARLMGGLQNLSPAQIPPAPTDPKGKPAQVAPDNQEEANMQEPEKGGGINGSLVLSVVGTIAAVIALWPIFSPIFQGDETSTPRITAQRNMDIRNGPGTNFDRIAVLNAGDHLDILGISDDDRWYQVLLPDGNTGWVVAASSAGEVSGPLGALAVVLPTNTPTATPTRTPTVTNTPTATLTVTDIPKPTDTPTASPTATDTLTATRTNTPLPSATVSQTPSNTPTLTPSNTPTPTETSMRRPTSTPTNTPRPTEPPAPSYPCDGRIPGVSGLLNQVHVQPSESSPSRPPLQRGSTVNILREASDFGEKWYEIEYNDGDDRGWILNTFIVLFENCP